MQEALQKPVHIKIDDQWYDATGYALAHPGGARFIRFFHGRDATDVFYALHSYGPNGATTAADRLAKLRKVEAPKEERKMSEQDAATVESAVQFWTESSDARAALTFDSFTSGINPVI